MEWWKILLSIFGGIGVVYTGLHVYFQNRSKAKIESFKSIMEESKKFREEFREELNTAKEEIKALREKVRSYETKIAELEIQLKEALTPPTWLYYYLQKPIKLFELETIIRRHVTAASDRILVIEDDPNTQKSLESMALSNGWNITRAINGKTAIESLKIHIPKLILIDLVMAVPDAFEALNAIHESKELSNVPIVVLSSSNLKEVERVFLHTKIHEALTQV